MHRIRHRADLFEIGSFVSSTMRHRALMSPAFTRNMPGRTNASSSSAAKLTGALRLHKLSPGIGVSHFVVLLDHDDELARPRRSLSSQGRPRPRRSSSPRGAGSVRCPRSAG